MPALLRHGLGALTPCALVIGAGVAALLGSEAIVANVLEGACAEPNRVERSAPEPHGFVLVTSYSCSDEHGSEGAATPVNETAVWLDQLLWIILVAVVCVALLATRSELRRPARP